MLGGLIEATFHVTNAVQLITSKQTHLKVRPGTNLLLP